MENTPIIRLLKMNDKVRIIEGFYTGLEGQLLSYDHLNDLYVVYNNDTPFNYLPTVPPSFIELID